MCFFDSRLSVPVNSYGDVGTLLLEMGGFSLHSMFQLFSISRAGFDSDYDSSSSLLSQLKHVLLHLICTDKAYAVHTPSMFVLT